MLVANVAQEEAEELVGSRTLVKLDEVSIGATSESAIHFLDAVEQAKWGAALFKESDIQASRSRKFSS